MAQNDCAYHSTDAPQNVEEGDFSSQHPYVAATLAVTMVGVGAFVALPGIVAGILGAVGFSSSGVAAGQHLPYYLEVFPLPVTY